MPRRPLPILLLVAFLAASLVACKLGPHKETAEELTETHQPKNGLITVRYPASFTAKKTGEGSVIVSRGSAGRGGVALGFTTIDKPHSTDLDELVRVIEPAGVKTHDQYAETSRKKATCAGQPGLEIFGTYRSQSGKPEARRACYFVRNGHGYSFTILAARDLMADEEALYLRIRNAVHFDK